MALAKDQLIEITHYSNGQSIPYLLTTKDGNAPIKYVLIVMPGGAGILNPRMINEQISIQASRNFLIRSRELFADQETAVISTDATVNTERMTAIIEDAKARFPNNKTYIIGTSKSTISTMYLASSLDGKVSGFIHTSSMASISSLDTRDFKSRQLIVHHENDGCYVTPYGSAKANHERYGTDFISIEGGISIGDACQAFAYHGYNGIEQEVIDKIKTWIKSQYTFSSL